MKKLLCIAIFSIAIMANANNKKEIVINNFKELKIEATVHLNATFSTNNAEKLSQYNFVVFGCGEGGNNTYDTAREKGSSHREARRERRIAVRKCRDLPKDGWFPTGGKILVTVVGLIK